MTDHADTNGFVSVASEHSVDDALSKLETALRARGITIFGVVDHSGEAARVGLTMRPTKLIIFGNPKAGTPLMVASPSIAIDLPLKILIWEDEHGQTWLSRNSERYLQARHHLPERLLPNIAIEALVSQAAT